jgi:hypothetical protein
LLNEQNTLTQWHNNWNKETASGNGDKAKEWERKVGEQQVKVDNLKTKFENKANKKTIVIVNALNSLKDVIGIPVKTLKKFMFGISIIMLYLFMMLTSFDIPQSGRKNNQKNSDTEDSDTETDDETDDEVSNSQLESKMEIHQFQESLAGVR